MSNPLNSPLEVGMRVLMILVEAFPAHLDINRLVLLDHGLLHSADLDGPESLHPPIPIRVGELGVKRQHIEDGLQVMIRAGLAEMSAEESGIKFWANESSEGFLKLLESDYAHALHDRANWVVEELGAVTDASLRERMREVSSHWSEEFEVMQHESGNDI
ncbi:ABC-three component system middle component 2 [Mycetocola reblochoni]|uniref:ABC-three component system middle component 2 n=1 Tax=Mycetocola reblochoni TaxID=331618 RepID=UPI003F9656C2